MTVWYTVATRDRAQAAECLAAWKAQGYRTAALFVLGMETVLEADLFFYVSDFQSEYDALNIAATMLVANHGAEIVVAGPTSARPDPTLDLGQIRAEVFASAPDGCFVIKPLSGPLWLGKGWIDQAYRGHGPFWPEYLSSWGEVEVTLVADRLNCLIKRPDIVQTWAPSDLEVDAGLFKTRQSASFPESSLWEP